MLTSTRNFRLICAALAACALLVASVRAQQRPRAPQPNTKQPVPAAEPRPPAEPEPSADIPTSETEERAKIVNSERWKRLEHEFNEWLSVQVIYTPQQVRYMQEELYNETSKMSAAELKQFLDGMEAKLNVVLSPDAAETRAWLGQYLSMVATGYREQLLKTVPDFVNMTAAQLEQQHLQLRARRLQGQQQAAAFSRGRGELMQATQRQQDRDRADAAAARESSRAPRFNTVQRTLAPRQYQRPQGIGFGFGWGFW
ncbi:MAG: hypothetical protein K2Y37_18880 [Pirellulales bacterium]|nr:hypothetical protein [Pirellulales bacterium]